MGTTRGKRSTFQAVSRWLRRQPTGVKAAMSVVAAFAAILFLGAVVRDHDNLFVAAEASHALGIAVLIYKLIKDGTCAGLSLKTQELTAIFLAVRLYCSFVMEFDIHTVLDTATLVATLWVVFMIRFKLRATYMEDKDTFAIYYVVIPCALLAVLIHPSTSHHLVNRILWAFCVYLEAVSVLPQLRLMQNVKIIESFTAHYVFALGIARFLSCAHWVLQVFIMVVIVAMIPSKLPEISLALLYIVPSVPKAGTLGVEISENVVDTRGRLLVALGWGLWPPMVLLSEIVQTFILADFCYYYIKSFMHGDLVMRLPSGVV